MRLDKFLKLSRLVKRRTLAKEMCAKGRISVDGHVAKAGTKVDVGNEIQIRYAQKLLTVRVEQLPDTVKKEAADTLYTLLSEQKKI